MIRSICSILGIMFIMNCSSQNHQTVGSLDLKVTWDLKTNFAEGGGHKAQFVIKNESDIKLTSDNWEMYWNMSPRTIKPASIQAPVTIEWISGDFYVMKPKKEFQLAPGDAIDVSYGGSYSVIKESDAPVGLYSVLYESEGSSTIHPVNDYTIQPFRGQEQIDRGEGDEEPIPTAEWLYESHSVINEIPEDQMQMIVPKPKSISVGSGKFEINSSTIISYESGLESEAELLSAFLNEILTNEVTIEESGTSDKNNILLQNSEVEPSGSYQLKISENDGAVISGDKSGVFYGSQSLKALIPAEYLERENESIEIVEVEIQDEPAFDYRGMHLDVGRNFHSVESVKHLIDAMAFYKLNKLHLNLTEDEGWRIEIEELPELTGYGAFRGHSKDESEFLHPSYGSGPYPDTDSGYGSGYYNREEYKDILKYAWQRHIEVIPEVNVPGHSRAAVKAMEYRYEKYMTEGNLDEAEKYRLIDPEDASKYLSAQWYTDNVICVCRESAFTFITTVIDDLIEMHEEAGVPLTIFHTGGDEVPAGAWTRSPICEEYLKEHPEIDNPKNLQKAYFQQIDEYIASKGLKTAGWEEIAMNFNEDGSWTPNMEFAGSDVIPYIWNSLWGAEDLGNRLANAGYPVVLCNVTNFYFDLAYNKDPREPGLYWAGFVDTRDAFEFVPYDVFKSIKVTADGQKYSDADFEGKEVLSSDGKKKIMGMQGQLWSETLNGGQDKLEYYYLPKMLGLAERAWFGQADWSSIQNREERNEAVDMAWNEFANFLGKKELPRLDHIYGGYNYRLPPPGAKIENSRLVVNTAYPGLMVRYTTDGSDPTNDSPVYTEPMEVGSEIIKLSTFDTRGRASLPTVINLK